LAGGQDGKENDAVVTTLGQDGKENDAVVTTLASINIGRSHDNNPWVVEDPMGLVTEEELKEHDLPPVHLLSSWPYFTLTHSLSAQQQPL
jgi:hypothetical protein